jgi:hypothetical protein
MTATGKLSTFDATRSVLEDYLDGNLYPPHLTITESQSLDALLSAGQLAPDTRLLVFEHNAVLYALPMRMVLAYNVIQGQTEGQPWMMTFCNACNTGMIFDPVIGGQRLHFQRRGSYDGLLLIWDEETGSYWQHITGECLHGASVGQQLNSLATTRHMLAAEAAGRNARFLASPLTTDQEKLSHAMEKMRANPERSEAMIAGSLSQEDTRRPRFELGLGVWKDITSSIFFPLTLLYTANNTLITEFDNRSLLIYQFPDAIAPVAAYVDTREARWSGDRLLLDDGAYIQHDLYFNADGQPHPLERPRQLLMRWYGFALTFPGCKVPTI